MVHNNIEFGIAWRIRGARTTTSVWFSSKGGRAKMHKDLLRNKKVVQESITYYTRYNKDDVRNE